MPAEHLQRVGHILARERRSLSEPSPDREHEFLAGATPAGGPCQATSAPSSLSGGAIPATASKASSGPQTWPPAGFVATRSAYFCEGGNHSTEPQLAEPCEPLANHALGHEQEPTLACRCFEADAAASRGSPRCPR
jgi:hypothetical protein